MTRTDLKPQQLAAVAAVVDRMADFQRRLGERIGQCQWPADDPVRMEAAKVRAGVETLARAVADAQAARGGGTGT